VILTYLIKRMMTTPRGMILTIKLLNGNRVVVGKSKVAYISLVPRIHQRLGLPRVSKAQRVAYFMGGHHEQIDT